MNSHDWIDQFTCRLAVLRPWLPARVLPRLAVDACSEFREMSPREAAEIVARRDFQA